MAAAGAASTERPATLPGRARRMILVGALVAAAAVAGVVALRQPVAVDAVQPVLQPLERTLLFTARVQTPARVELGATITGRVRSVHVREGEAVTAGAVLVLLEDDEARAAEAQAEAALRQAEAQMATQQRATAPGADAQLAQAQAVAQAAERELQRTQELLAQRFVSPARLDDAERAAEVARAQLAAARAQADSNRSPGPQAAALRAQRDLAAAGLQAAAARLAQTRLRAPADGHVLLRQVEPGQIVQAGKALVTLAAAGTPELVAPVDERFLAQLAPGQTARVLADAYPSRPFDARVVSIAPSVDALRGSVEVKLSAEGMPPSFLREDMTLSVAVVTGRRDRALVLPLKALLDLDRDRARVLVDAQGRAALREVTLGLRTLDQAEIAAGLKAGDTVLLQPSLTPGTRVRAKVLSPADALRAAGAAGEGAGQALSSGFSR